MREDCMPQPDMVGESVDHNAAAIKFVERALSEIEDLAPTSDDAKSHIEAACRELRAAKRALKE